MRTTGALVPQLLRDLGLEQGIQGWRAMQEWPDIVGSRIARRTRAVGFHDGALRVEVEGAVWRFELDFLKRRLLKELQHRLGSSLVRELQFVQARGGIQR